MTVFTMTVFDVVGLLGVFSYVLGFVGLQLWSWQPQSYHYLLSNLLGSVFTLVSLYYSFNLASVISQLIWFAISMFSLVQAVKRNQQQTVLPTQQLVDVVSTHEQAIHEQATYEQATNDAFVNKTPSRISHVA